MKEKLYLTLDGHKYNKKELQGLIDKANGDVETFRTLYRKRFNIAARLITEDHSLFKVEKVNDDIIAIN